MRAFKNRHSFAYYFARRGLVALCLAVLLFFGGTFGLYYYYCQSIKNNAAMINDRAYETISEREYHQFKYNELSFKEGSDQENSGIEYIGWCVDVNTGDIIADSDMRAYMLVRKDKTMYTCEMDKFGEAEEYVENIFSIPPKYNVLTDFHNMAYGFERLVVPLNIYLTGKTNKVYVFTMHDYYIDGSEFYPGVLDVNHYDEETGKESFYKSFDLTPDNADEYEHFEVSDQNSIICLTLGSRCSAGFKNELMTELGDSDGTVTSDGSPFPGRVSTIYRSNTMEFDGREIVAYEYTNRYFMHDCWLHEIILGFSLLVIAIVSSVFISLKNHYDNKLFCDMEDYRKCLMDSMAHDLRSPLTVMGGYAQNLFEDVNGDKRQYYADSIVRNVDYMNKIITDNLELSRLSTKEIIRNSEPVEFMGILSRLLEKYRPALSERGVSIVMEGSFTRKVNPLSIESALENIISNANKYVNDNGQISIYSKGNTLVISNTTGEKFEENIDTLWQPFVKGDKSRGNSKGTGLGLSIAKRVLDINKIKSSLKYDSNSKIFMVIIH